jgi:hypothetical protein
MTQNGPSPAFGYSGTTRWSRNGTETGSIGYILEAGGLRLL